MEMWCYQKPGFEALLLAELQKQQQCSQFCDTLLKAEGVSVPAHSCVLSAISPQISSALTSTPLPLAGQSRLLEFRTVSACTLLHMVRLLYSGEMTGEGENEKQEAISAAAKLGIIGLVEVTKRDRIRRKEEGEGEHIEVGVQTEPHVLEKSGLRRGRWRRAVRDGTTLLWKEILSDDQKDMSTQTEVLEMNEALPAHPAASLTVDVSAFHSLAQPHSHFASPQIQVYRSDDHPVASMQDSTLATHTSVDVVATPHSSVPLSIHLLSNQVTPCAADAQSWWTGLPGSDRHVVDSEDWENKQLEQFQGNIPEFIDYFLNPDREEGSHSVQATRRQGAQCRGARRTGRGTKPPKRPQNRIGGRGRGRLTETVVVQDVGVSKLQKLFLQRGGVRPLKPGQGGGTVGRRFHMNTREHMKRGRRYQRRQRCSKEWEFSHNGDALQRKSVRGNKQSGWTNTDQQFHQDIISTGRARRARATPTASLSPSSLPVPLYSVQPLSSCAHSLQRSRRRSVLSPVAANTSPAASILHTTSLHPPAPPSQEEQPEHIDRLLEEVMMGLDILTNDNAAPRSEPTNPNSSISFTCTSSRSVLTQDKQSQSSHVLEACPVIHGSAQVGALTGSCGSSTSKNEVPIVQPQKEGELNDMLDHFIQSFDQNLYNCTAGEMKEKSGESSAKAGQTYIVVRKYSKTKTQTVAPKRQPAKHSKRATSQKSRKANTQPSQKASSLSRQCKRTSEKKTNHTVSSSDRRPRTFPEQDKQLQQMPVVRLERSCPLAVEAKLQGRCQIQEIKNATKTRASSTLAKFPCERKQIKQRTTKTYSIRTQLKEANVTNSFLEESFLQKPARKRGRPRKNRQLPCLSNDESVRPQIEPQAVEPYCMEEQLETVQPQGEMEDPPGTGRKRGAEPDEDSGHDATVAKKVCIEQTSQPNTDTSIPSSNSADSVSEATHVEMEDAIDVETVSLSSAGDGLHAVEDGKKNVWSKIYENFSETKDNLSDEELPRDSDETIDVEEEFDGITHPEKERDNCKEGAEKSHCKTAAARPHVVSPLSHSARLRSTASWEDEDIDVIGSSSPLPDRCPSEGEEEDGDVDIDVVGEKTN